ncbi:MAG: riboflavin synthase [Bacteroidia bacterium]|nr:riboflavin synthase [Bacteroidia bacterium]
MFTGIIETTGNVKSIDIKGNNKVLCIEAPFVNELKVDQSISHNGVCLTVTKLLPDSYLVECIDETLQRSNLGLLSEGDIVNLERSMQFNGRMDGHFVLGHVGQTAICLSALDINGSWLYGFQYETFLGNITVPKGSVCVNGVSLTVIDSKTGYFSVAVIPYTYEHTNFQNLLPGSVVNLEFDIIGKYVKALKG